MLDTRLPSMMKWLQLPAEVDFDRYVGCAWVHAASEAAAFRACPFSLYMWGFQGSAAFWHPPETTSLVMQRKRHK